MYKFLSKNGQIISFAVGIVISLVFLMTVLSKVGDQELSADTFKENGVAMETPQVVETLEGITLFDFGFYATYGLLIVSIAAAVLLSLAYFFMNFKVSALKGLIPIIVMAIIFFVVYSSYNPDASDIYKVKVARDAFFVDDGASKIVSGGITTAGFALAAAFISFIAAEIVNVFR